MSSIAGFQGKFYWVKCFKKDQYCFSLSRKSFLQTRGARSSWKRTFLNSQKTFTVIFCRFALPNCPYCSTCPFSTFSPSSYLLPGLNLQRRNLRFAFYFFSAYRLMRMSLSVWLSELRDFKRWSISPGSVISWTESALPLRDWVLFLLMMGTSVGEKVLMRPEGMELVYLRCVRETGGRSSLLIIITFYSETYARTKQSVPSISSKLLINLAYQQKFGKLLIIYPFSYDFCFCNSQYNSEKRRPFRRQSKCTKAKELG